MQDSKNEFNNRIMKEFLNVGLQLCHTTRGTYSHIMTVRNTGTTSSRLREVLGLLNGSTTGISLDSLSITC